MAMTVLACAMHWYVSGMFVVPVVSVGTWSWWKTRNAPAEDDYDGPQPPPGADPAAQVS
jgi:hypothetical protein